MVRDVMVPASFVVVSVAVLACFPVKSLLTWLKTLHQVASQHSLLISSRHCVKVQNKTQDCGAIVERQENGTRFGI
jgi:hypothetical protein